MRLVPRSLFGRLMLVLASGLVVAQLLGTAINLQERDSLLVRASGMQPAQRIVDIVKLLDSLSATERTRIVGIFNLPPLVVVPVSIEILPATPVLVPLPVVSDRAPEVPEVTAALLTVTPLVPPCMAVSEAPVVEPTVVP